MDKTKNLGLPVIRPGDDYKIVDWAIALDGDDAGSAMQIIDDAVGKLQSSEVYSEQRPEGQKANDVWHEIIRKE